MTVTVVHHCHSLHSLISAGMGRNGTEKSEEEEDCHLHNIIVVLRCRLAAVAAAYFSVCFVKRCTALSSSSTTFFLLLLELLFTANHGTRKREMTTRRRPVLFAAVSLEWSIIPFLLLFLLLPPPPLFCHCFLPFVQLAVSAAV